MLHSLDGRVVHPRSSHFVGGVAVILRLAIIGDELSQAIIVETRLLAFSAPALGPYILCVLCVLRRLMILFNMVLSFGRFFALFGAQLFRPRFTIYASRSGT